MVKYQNNFISSWLFRNALPEILEKGIIVLPLFEKETEIFSYTFDFDEWPSQHTDASKYRRPYQGSIFDVRDHYNKVFHEESFKDTIGALAEDQEVDTSKVYKIQYTLNLLPSFG